jgi:YHS domain-containing protein
VETGWRSAEQVEIRNGLNAGDRIVVSGNFMIDSESRMKMAAAGITTPGRDPVCGMEIDQDKAATAGLSATHDGKKYYFCSDDCKKKFEATPDKYLTGNRIP